MTHGSRKHEEDTEKVSALDSFAAGLEELLGNPDQMIGGKFTQEGEDN